MIFFLADGRLGNQIFQYLFLKTIKKKEEKIIVSGFEELKEVFKINDVINLNKKRKWLRGFLYIVMRPVLNFLADKKIVSSIAINNEKVFENYKREASSYTQVKGFITFFIFVRLGFFQSEFFFDKAFINDLNFKKKYLFEADNFLNKIPQNTYKVFIHIRRSDYKDFKVYGKNTILPIKFYKKQINWFLEHRDYCYFIFLSDDPKYIEKEFMYINKKIISAQNHFGTDLAIMTKCKGAILSPSSFGWWGSYLMKKKDKVFVPKYWLGFNSSIYYQAKPIAKFMEEVEVSEVVGNE
jgi:hypothetical protein